MPRTLSELFAAIDEHVSPEEARQFYTMLHYTLWYAIGTKEEDAAIDTPEVIDCPREVVRFLLRLEDYMMDRFSISQSTELVNMLYHFLRLRPTAAGLPQAGRTQYPIEKKYWYALDAQVQERRQKLDNVPEKQGSSVRLGMDEYHNRTRDILSGEQGSES